MAEYAEVNNSLAMLHMGRIYKEPLEAIAQAVENEVDAGAKTIWVVLTPSTVEVVGDGHGMVPKITPKDNATLQEYKQLVKAGKGDINDDIRQKVSRTSRRSLEWMMRHIAHSSKIPGEDVDVRGMRGIGSLAFLTYARSATYFSKPNHALEQDYIDNGGEHKERSRTWQLSPPTRDQLDRDDSSYQITKATKDLVNPWGKSLPHGTSVVVKEFLPGAQKKIQQTQMMIHALRKRFGEDVRSGRYELYIVDRLLKQEKTYSIEPVEHKGILVLAETSEVNGVPFKITLYHNPGTNSPIQVLRKGSGVLELTELPDFKGKPWPDVSGYVEFPNFPNDGMFWDSSKTNLLPTEEFHSWVERIKKLAPQIEDQINLLQQNKQEKELTEIGAELSHALGEAVSELPQFAGLAVPGIPRRIRARPKTDTGSGNDDVRATVYNEHNVGIPNVQIKLFRQGKLIETKATGKSGAITFGRKKPGEYQLQIVLPQGGEAITEKKLAFETSGSTLGFRAVFRVQTGTKAPQKLLQSATIRFGFFPFEDPDLPWRGRLTVGNIDVNTSAESFRKAMLKENEVTMAILLAQYSAAAFVGHFFAHLQPSDILIQESMLFGRTLERFLARLETIKRSRAAQRKTSRKK